MPSERSLKCERRSEINENTPSVLERIAENKKFREIICRENAQLRLIHVVTLIRSNRNL